jgi:hypothetical protein
MVLGDFRYFIIVDRIGMDVELIPHLFGASGRPLGQRGIYAIWRNNSAVGDVFGRGRRRPSRGSQGRDACAGRARARPPEPAVLRTRG